MQGIVPRGIIKCQLRTYRKPIQENETSRRCSMIFDDIGDIQQRFGALYMNYKPTGNIC